MNVLPATTPGNSMPKKPTPKESTPSASLRLKLAAALCLFAASAAIALAQATTSLQGTIADAKGGRVAKATITATNTATGKSKSVTSDADGHFAIPGLAPGSYNLTAGAQGFSDTSRKGIQLTDQGAPDVALSLAVASATTDITVDADVTHSVAAALAPMDALLDETSARTEITSAMINNFMSPVADYGEAVEMAPGTFTTNGNGVGLGQSKTQFRGFADGNYDIDFDGVPFYDTNTPTHHSWAFFPAQFLGGIDFDRSPGTASTIGPTPFGGTIHLLSRDFSPVQNIRAQFSGGSFNTYLYDLQYDAGAFGPGHKFNMNIDVHHLQSQGYQTNNTQQRNGGEIKFQYNPTSTLSFTGVSAVIWLDANTPNFNATRCQMYGVAPANATALTNYSCTLANTPTGLQPYTGAGLNFLLTNTPDTLLYLNKIYNFYHVPTDFEYIGVHKEFAHNFTFNAKGYTYDYDNSEKYSNAVPITDNTALVGTPYAPLGITKLTTANLCNVQSTKKGVTALPCSVDKYNSYRKYGETSELDQVSRFGILRAGLWFERGLTNRHQYPTDPLNNYANQSLPNFAEKFDTDSYQPFVEYQLNIGKRIKITPGMKFAYYAIGTQQFADDGKTIGCLVAGCNYATGTNINPKAYINNGGTYFAALPSGSISYRIKSNWSAYFQGATGSVVPPSSVFDFQQGTSGQALPPATLPKQQKNTTYQAGTVLKLKRVTLDADAYHIYFDNSYSSVTNSAGEPVFFAQPASITKGFEAESNIYVTKGLSVYLNASVGRATYTGSLPVTCTGTAPACVTAVSTQYPTLTPQLVENTPSGLYVQQAPKDIESEGITYQHKAYDFGIFNKRVGTFYIDNGAYHNQYTVTPFSLTNLFFNYTIRTSNRFNNTKFRVSFNNIFDEHNVTGNSIAGGVVSAPNLSANGTSYADAFNTLGPTPYNGSDAISILPGRSIMFGLTFGFSPKGR